MPAYFSIVFELNKSPTAIQDFCTALIKSGLTFKCGYRHYKQASFNDILKWNQNKLNHNFKLGFTEHYSHDFKQMEFTFSFFSEVRLFVMNETESSSFCFHLIFPEDDLVEYIKCSDTHSPIKKTERMEVLKNLARSVWKKTELLSVQTAWECSDIPPMVKDISETVTPQAEPFCIIPKPFAAQFHDLPFEIIDHNSVLIEEKDHWFYL